MAVSSRERTSQRSTWLVQSLALETHWRASAVLSIARSAAGTKRTRSCSPTALPSPRQADNFFFLLLSSSSSSSSSSLALKAVPPGKPRFLVASLIYKSRADGERAPLVCCSCTEMPERQRHSRTNPAGLSLQLAPIEREEARLESKRLAA
jgi:hypothetical protein